MPCPSLAIEAIRGASRASADDCRLRARLCTKRTASNMLRLAAELNQQLRSRLTKSTHMVKELLAASSVVTSAKLICVNC